MTIHDAPPTEPTRSLGEGGGDDAGGAAGVGGIGASATATATRPGARRTDAAGPPKLGYQPALDGLRGLALPAIVVFHAELPFAPGAFLSVSTFFTLSGFLITALALSELA